MNPKKYLELYLLIDEARVIIEGEMLQTPEQKETLDILEEALEIMKHGV